MSRVWLPGFGVASLLPYVLPTRWLRYFELSSKLSTYRRLGVPLANHVAQNGGLIKRALGRKYPETRRALDARSIVRLLRVSYDQERFHMAGFLFFSFSAVYAAACAEPGWMALLLLTNVTYNLYPIWLQQYVRMRLVRVDAKRRRAP